eukprot:TRINITY_DN9082_c2_g1_i5.p1 TRINITY_DN9082_c2_g1~~TRINITY_DN9082_c2_g1_i5.p1  ORF type:complete len:109 (-),score=9.26 TRINITY_DN9082_c2_g1_i5:161-487(-)
MHVILNMLCGAMINLLLGCTSTCYNESDPFIFIAMSSVVIELPRSSKSLVSSLALTAGFHIGKPRTLLLSWLDFHELHLWSVYPICCRPLSQGKPRFDTNWRSGKGKD